MADGSDDGAGVVRPAATRAAAAAPRQRERRCRQCGCRLAKDHAEDRCSPCRREEVFEAIPADALVLPRGVHLDDLALAWADGIDEVAVLLAVGRDEAARTVWRAGLVSPSPRLDETAFVLLAVEPRAAHTELARRLGVSRWTLASWRELFGERLRDTPPAEVVAGQERPGPSS